MKRILVTTIRRGRPLEDSGRAYVVDWSTQKVVEQCGMLPVNARFPSNPRGGIRGLRGVHVGFKDGILIASNDTISILNEKLQLQGTIHNRLFCNLHELRAHGGDLYAVSCGLDAIVSVSTDSVLKSFVHHEDLFTGRDRFDDIDRHGITRPNSLDFYKGEPVVSLAESNIISIGQKDEEDLVLAFHKGKPHSVTVSGDVLYWTMAEDRTVCSQDMLSGHMTTQFTDKKPWWFRDTQMTRWGWLRGMAIAKNIMFVGSSPYARVIAMCPDYGIKKGEIKLSNLKSEAVSSIVLFPGDWK